MKKAVYQGSFDPFTIGHLDIVKRGAACFDELTVAVLYNPEKSPLFSVEERVNMIKEAVKDIPNVKVDFFSGLLVHYAQQKDIQVSLRGLRSVTDYEYELQIAQYNRILSQGALETFFMMTSPEYAHLSSSAVRQVAQFHGRLSGMVPDNVLDLLYERFDYQQEDRIL